MDVWAEWMFSSHRRPKVGWKVLWDLLGCNSQGAFPDRKLEREREGKIQPLRRLPPLCVAVRGSWFVQVAGRPEKVSQACRRAPTQTQP